MELHQVLQIVEIKKSTYYYRSQKNDSKEIEMIREIAYKHVFYGYRRIYISLRQKGIKINHKKVYRIYTELNLQKPIKVKRNKHLNTTKPENLTEAKYPNHVWALDFEFIPLGNGRTVKILTIEDLFTRKGIGVYADFSINHAKVIEVLTECFEKFGKPDIIKSDNGGEFRCHRLQKYLSRLRIKQEFIPPGSPYYNGHLERFNGSAKYECLLLYDFDTLSEVRKAAEEYLCFYNSERPHSSLGYKSPVDFETDWKSLR